MKKLNKRKKALLSLISLVLAAAIGAGLWYGLSVRTADPVVVFPFQYLGMTEYWGDSQETYGPVTTDNIQTVFLSETQTVTEILVQQGDSVKKGAAALRYNLVRPGPGAEAAGGGEGEAPAAGGQGSAPADQGYAAYGDPHRVPGCAGG